MGTNTVAVSRVLQEEVRTVRMVRVESSNVEEVGYVDGIGRLWVRFHWKPGAKFTLYAFDHVPRSVYEGFFTAPSKGVYFHRAVKDRYQFRPVL